MLNFFRKHQRYFFLVITVVIIISFSFFGTYNTLGSNQWREQIAFTAINGKEIPRIDVDEMSHFLATDSVDKTIYGGVWGPNFLNDGVIRKDFLETGLAQELILDYAEDFRESLNKKLAKEKRYTLYTHPNAPFVGVKSVWHYFSPDMIASFEALQSSQDPLDPLALRSKIKLYLAEKQIPAPLLRQVILYQMQQYSSWLKPDAKLEQIDLSLFGYHKLEDWFGADFTYLVSEFIINAAILAESRGYIATKEEALTELVKNAAVSYQQNLKNPNLGVRSPEEYFSEQLRLLNMDQNRAVRIWQQVLLFRKFFQDAGNNALVDALMTDRLDRFTSEEVTVDLYELPVALKDGKFNDLIDFETYLYAVAKQNKNNPLEVPTEALPVEDVAKKYPELVEKIYELSVQEVSQKKLQSKISLKEVWSWELDEKNWSLLTKQFPTLGVKKGSTREDRFDALESLEPTVRSVVDAFARDEIVKNHPEWVTEAMNVETPKVMVVGLRLDGETPFKGVSDKETRGKLLQALDNATLSSEVSVDSPLYHYSADGKNFYRIAVIKREDKPSIVSFSAARADDSLDKVKERLLEKHYLAIREKEPSKYQNEKKEWKMLNDVKESVAESFFNKVWAPLEALYNKENTQKEKTSLAKDGIARTRFFSYMEGAKEHLATGKEGSSLVRSQENQEAAPDALKPSFADQWKIEKKTVHLNRLNTQDEFDLRTMLSKKEGEWSEGVISYQGNPVFYQITGHSKASGDRTVTIAEQTRELQEVLGSEAKRDLMRQVLLELKAKEALSLQFTRVQEG